jgi:hypothetical protein
MDSGGEPNDVRRKDRVRRRRRKIRIGIPIVVLITANTSAFPYFLEFSCNLEWETGVERQTSIARFNK